MHERNVEGLRQMLKRRGMRRLRGHKELSPGREGRAVNFKTVAEVAGVSTVWLYKEPQIKERIEHLRQQQVERKSLTSKTRASPQFLTNLLYQR